MFKSRSIYSLVFEALSVLLILASFIVIVLNYDNLPDTIPSHFTFSGKPNDFSGKESIWLLSVFGVLQYIMLTVITLFIRKIGRAHV